MQNMQMCHQWNSERNGQALSDAARENHPIEKAKIVVHIRERIASGVPGAIEGARDPSAIDQGS